ncbi:MAG: 3-phosphoshikimate 1-carboxyvinyltransferase [Muribaculaceae bacterium]|nr:3-phosphoshikimate 1-carboxyvinyltransferase [Muribaculaceae bacterium]
MQKKVMKDFKTLNGVVSVPSDKSISHRSIIFSSLAKGKSVIKNFSNGEDPKSTLEIFRKLGVDIDFVSEFEVVVNSCGKLASPGGELACNNSGTTMRLLSGVLSGQEFDCVLTGDESLSNRPMKRVIEPLELMGAKILSNDFKAPLEIFGRELHAVDYSSKIASAQVKSCVLLAGMNVKDGVTSYTEPSLSRNHTELMLKSMGANILTEGTTTKIEYSSLAPLNIEICGDISSAAYFIAAGLIIPGAKIILKNVGLNPTRSGIIDVIKQMGGNIRVLDSREVCSELVGDILVEYSELKGCEINGDIIPRLIDEIPILAVLAACAEGETKISDAQDLRHKESDRISAVVSELEKLGAQIEETPDGMLITGSKLLGGVEVKTYYDHRLAMSLYVAGLVCQKEILINGFEWVNISFPTFEKLFTGLMRK